MSGSALPPRTAGKWRFNTPRTINLRNGLMALPNRFISISTSTIWTLRTNTSWLLVHGGFKRNVHMAMVVSPFMLILLATHSVWVGGPESL